MVLRCGFGLPAALDHDGLMVLDDEGGACDAHARLELRAQNDGRLMPVALLGEDRALRCDLWLGTAQLKLALLGALAAAFGRHFDRLDLDLLAGTDEAEALLVPDLEQG